MSTTKQNKEDILKQADNVSEPQQIQEIIEQISKLITSSPTDTKLLHARAHLYEKQESRGKAINDYLQILSIDKNDLEAQTRLEMLRTILRYNNTDIYASPNTNYDPWLE